VDPQPAALMTIASTPARSKVSIMARARSIACGSWPACTISAPQQPWSDGAITSQPSARSTRTVAAFTSAK
jgi:hypothetical protein